MPVLCNEDAAGYNTFVVDTGVSVSMPRGFYGRICNRAGCGISAQTVSGDIRQWVIFRW